MVNMTLAVPEDLHKIMRKHLHIKWSEIARKALWNEARKIELMDSILSKSELSEKDAEELGKKIKKEIAKRHGL